jgi:hypothetical protein
MPEARTTNNSRSAAGGESSAAAVPLAGRPLSTLQDTRILGKVSIGSQRGLDINAVPER